MSNLREVLDRTAAEYAPATDLFERVRDRRRSRDRNRRIANAALAVVLTVGSIGGLINLLRPTTTVFFNPPQDPYAGTWVSTDTDGSIQTMTLRGSDGSYQLRIADKRATVCAGAPSTMTGTAEVRDGDLVVAMPALTCDDGTEPVYEREPLDKQLRNYTLAYDGENDTLNDSLSVQWLRPSAAPDETTEVVSPGGMWPQESLDEVREAQSRADAGDPAVTWQVAPAVVNDAAPPGDAPIFTRYLQQVLGWESFRWGDQVELVWNADCASSQGCTSFEIGFARCAAGKANPLYPKDGARGDVPDDADGTTCAPTIDDAAYETVTVVARQPLRKGPGGLWVISDSYPARVFRQTAPLSETEVAAVVDEFLQSRVKGEGAEEHADPSWDEVPLKYEASDGARFDRFDYDLHGPMWPKGSFAVTVRLYADNGNTEVAQQFRVENAGRSQLLVAFQPRSTTVNGRNLPEPYDIFDGEVTFGVPPPWYGFFDYGANTIALDSGDQEEADFAVLPDALPMETGCKQAPAPANAEALARSIRSNPGLEVTAPVAARVGSVDALRLDVEAAADAAVCDDIGTSLVLAPRGATRGPALARGERMRLYLLDLPKGLSARTLAIAFVAPVAGFESVLKEAPPILESFKFRTP